MAAFGVRIACYEHGVTLLTLCFVCRRSGSNNDNMNMRVVRRRAGEPEYVLPGYATFSMLSQSTGMSWQWVDPSVPYSGDWDYVLQVMKMDGGGSFSQLLLSAVHNKR